MAKIRFHDLRHPCATLLRHEGVPMEDIQKWLGHSEITTTEGIYAHFDDTQNVKTLAKIPRGAGREAQPRRGEMNLAARKTGGFFMRGWGAGFGILFKKGKGF